MKVRLIAIGLCLCALGAQAQTPARIALPGSSGEIGFDDIVFVPALDRVLVPAGQTGYLALLAPESRTFTVISGVTATAPPRGHFEGTTSAAYADGDIVASDRNMNQLVVIDATSHRILQHVQLAGGPDYVRFVATLHQLWVTEPGKEQIQLFDFDPSAGPTAKPLGAIRVPGGPESLVIDADRNRAYTNLWKDETIAIDIVHRTIAARWKNTCKGSRGLAEDSGDDLLFIGCQEGKVVELNAAAGGKVIDTATAGAGIDIISYDPALRHLYVPGARSATLTIIALGRQGHLTPLTTLPAAKGSHCVTNDNHGHVFVCDPEAGALLEYRDGPGI